MSEPSPRLVLYASAASAALVGFALGLLVAEGRRVSEFAQVAQIAHTLADVGERCVASLDGITRAAIVVARTAPLPELAHPAAARRAAP